MTEGYILIWLLVFASPYGQTVFPGHLKTQRECMMLAAAPRFADLETQCVSVSRPVIMPRRSPLVTPQVSA